jgi:NAD(P)-dependent dehydrogenase (short-subunit alcohol dehydrogenase family)
MPRTALVTGGASGLGAATAARLRAEGLAVTTLDVSGPADVNAIAPAVIATPMNDSTAPDVLAHVTSLIPMKRVGRPEEVAELVAYLSSDRVSFSTGAVYDISGGRTSYKIAIWSHR